MSGAEFRGERSVVRLSRTSFGRGAQSLNAGRDAAGAPHRAATGPQAAHRTLDGSGFWAGFGLRRSYMRPAPGARRRSRQRPPDSRGLTRPVPGGPYLSRRLLVPILALAALAVLAPGAGAATQKRVFAPAAADSGVLVFKVRGRGRSPGQARISRAARRAPGREGRSDPGGGAGAAFSGSRMPSAWRARAADERGRHGRPGAPGRAHGGRRRPGPDAPAAPRA